MTVREEIVESKLCTDFHYRQKTYNVYLHELTQMVTIIPTYRSELCLTFYL